jgi:mutator protein MutT
VIEHRGRILIAQRPPGTFLAGFWEFPGGKRKDGETLEQCLVREVREELGVAIRPGRFVGRADHAYPDRDVVLYFVVCSWLYGRAAALECRAFCWAPVAELKRFNFLPADTDVINELQAKRGFYFGPGL